MPRKGYGSKVGGARTGAPGTSYPNRTDLNGPQPIRTAPGQPYGSAKQQEQAQQAVPLPGGGGHPSPTGGAPGAAGPMPGDLTPLSAPSLRPDEPITAGVDIGPGPGSDALASSPRNRGTSALQQMAMETNDPFLSAIAERARRQR